MDSKSLYFCWLSFLFFISFYCEWTSRKDRLVSHSNVRHPGPKVRVKIASDASFTSWTRQSVSPATDETQRSTNVNEDSSTTHQTQLTATSPVTTPAATSTIRSAFSSSNEHQLQQQPSYMNEQLLNLNTNFGSLLVTKSSISTAKEANKGEQ